MDVILVWVNENKQWLFSGIGVAIIGFVVHRIFKSSSNQTIRSGNNSINIQASRDANLNIASKKKENDVGEE